MDYLIPEPLMKKKMENKNCPYCDLRLEPTDNGHKVCFYEKIPSRGGLDHVDRTKREFVYSNKELNKALVKYKEISECIQEYGEGNYMY